MSVSIAINGRFLTRPATGVERYAMEILRALDCLLDSEQVRQSVNFYLTVPANGPTRSPFRNIPLRHRGWSWGLLWEHVEMPLRNFGALLVGLCSTGPSWVRNQIVVIHDATPVRIPEAFGFLFRTWYRWLMPTLGRKAKRIVTVSNFSKLEVMQAYGISTQKMEVISPSGDHIQRVRPEPVSDLLTEGKDRKPFALVVGTLAAQKNICTVIKAMSLLTAPDFDIVVAGGQNPRVFFQDESHGGGEVPNGIKWVGYVSDAQLSWLYRNATCFIFPSLYEGFGIPTLEAMHLGCPVLASNAAAIPEVCGDAVLYFDPLDCGQLKELLLRIFQDEGLRGSLVERGYRNALRYSWHTSASKFLALCVAVSKEAGRT